MVKDKADATTQENLEYVSEKAEIYRAEVAKTGKKLYDNLKSGKKKK